MKKGGKTKKPISKKVATLNEQLQRRRGMRDLQKRFLIVCEDDKSAPRYFEALIKVFGISATSVEVVGSGDYSLPLQVVSRAIDLKRAAASKRSGTEPFDHVWCVIDGDYGDKIANARQKAQANDVELAISTMCFEYWILLHFEKSGASTYNCDEMVRNLKKHLPEYDKGSFDFSNIVAMVHDASLRAESLRKPGLERGELPEKQNPCSEVYKLVNKLLREPVP